MGCISQTQEELIEFFGEPITSPCFPTIGDQGSLGSSTSL